MEEVVQRIRDIVSSVVKIDARELRVGSHRFVFDASRFLKVGLKNGRVGFVDGGCAEILSVPGLSVFFLRAYASVYENGVRVSRVWNEGFVIVRVVKKEVLVYVVEPVGLSLSVPDIGLNDSLLSRGFDIVSPAVVAGVARHVLEWQLINDCFVDCVVRDGALDECVEDKFRDVCPARCIQIGLCKTTSALTDSGVSVPFFLGQHGSEGVWLYDCGSSGDVNIGFVRLHELSRRVFRVDVRGGASLADAVGFLLPFCADASFIGYPYGLVDADLMACMRESERQVLRNLFFAKTGLQGLEQDAHDVLNIMH